MSSGRKWFDEPLKDNPLAIAEAWEALGYAVVEDCAREWTSWARRVRRLEIKEKYFGLKEHDKVRLSRARAEKRMCEDWLKSDFCYGLCGYDGDLIIEKLKHKLYDYGVR